MTAADAILVKSGTVEAALLKKPWSSRTRCLG